MKPFRTYHPLTRFIAMVIFLASALPFIGHACMMADAHDMPMMKQCCCDDAHDMHAGMEMTGRDCNEAEEHTRTLHGDCCSVDFLASSFDATARTNKVLAEELTAFVLVTLPSQDVFEPVFQKTVSNLQDTGPPPASPLSLHILHSRFQN